MLTAHVAIVPEAQGLDLPAAAAVTAAIQKQVTRDFGPIWNVAATIDVFARLEDVPSDYWPVLVRDDIQHPTLLGFHKTKHNQPFALVLFDDDWSITASHEILEMLADPSGDRLVAGESVKPGLGRVNYLLEICDPVQKAAYKVNEIAVCDFCTPQYFNPVTATGTQYSFASTVRAPRQVARGGYLTFFDPVAQHWWQMRWFEGPQPVIVDLGVDDPNAAMPIRRPAGSLREMADRRTPPVKRSPSSRRGPANAKRRRLVREGNATAVREAIQQLHQNARY